MNREVRLDKKNNRILETILFNEEGERHSERVPTQIRYSDNGMAKHSVKHFYNGKLHYLGGYAVTIKSNKDEFVRGLYFINGKRYSEQEFENHPRVLNYLKTGDPLGVKEIKKVNYRKEEFKEIYTGNFKNDRDE